MDKNEKVEIVNENEILLEKKYQNQIISKVNSKMGDHFNLLMLKFLYMIGLRVIKKSLKRYYNVVYASEIESKQIFFIFYYILIFLFKIDLCKI